MTVKELLGVLPELNKISFVYDNCRIEEIDCNKPCSYREIRKHYGEKVHHVFAMSEDEIGIDIK